ncbi:MAG: ABC-F family ATP-binding cassette domain-containing protein [Pseudomonadota bacterium]
MLHINDLTFRIEGRALFDKATAAISEGWKVGFTGRNGAGKSTLFRLIRGEASPDDGAISLRKGRKLGGVAQEAPAGPESLLETVLAADVERAELLAEAEIATDPMRIAEVQMRLADIDAYSAESRAASILAGLGFSEAEQARACAEFSGGWRMRVALAGALFAAPDVLLLDEPTNYLDLEGSLWLISYLKTYPHTVIIISHDRDLLNTSVSHILHLEAAKLTLYAGNYDQFERQRSAQIEQQLALKSRQDARRKELQAFVDRFRAKASKARQAQSRVKMLEKMSEISIVSENPPPPFQFPDPKPMAPPLVRLDEVRLGYDGRPVLSDISLRIDDDDRIALLGPNGEGKTTLAKAISGRLQPLTGSVFKHKKLKIGFFAQHQIDELNPAASPYDHVRELMREATEAQVRAKVAAFGFGPEKADTKAAKLSGGEKARLLFNLAAFHAPHILVLDEPTNHLDMESRAALTEALNAYSGAVILISHDPHLIEACADRLWLVRDGAVQPFDGALKDYRKLILSAARSAGGGDSRSKAAVPASPPIEAAQASAAAEPAAPPARKPTAEERQAQRRASADARKALQPLKKKAAQIEADVDACRKRIARLDTALAAPGLFEEDPDRAAQLAKGRSKAVDELEKMEEAWLLAAAEYEDAVAALG